MDNKYYESLFKDEDKHGSYTVEDIPELLKTILDLKVEIESLKETIYNLQN